MTMRDFLVALNYIYLYYTGEELIFVKDGGLEDVTADDGLSELGRLFYSQEKKEISEATAEFGYAELCLVFDNLYGLKEAHGIDSFDALAVQTGRRDALKSTDTSIADKALYKTIYQDLDDLHSTFAACSPNWSGKKVYIFATSGGSGIGKTAEKLEPYMKGAGISDAKSVSSVGELTSWMN